MATLLLTAAGTAIAGPIGGAIGAVIGQGIDGALFAPKARQGPRLGDLAVQTSSYGTAIPKLFGTMRVAGSVIWATDLIERQTSSGGGKGRPKTVDYSYAASFAVALSARPIRGVGRIWADGKLLRGAAGDFKSRTGFRLLPGDEDQAPDPLIVATEGVGRAPAFRGIAYAVFENMELAEFGNRIPSLSFEVIADDGPVAIGAIAAALSPQIVAGAGSAILAGYAASGDSVRGALADLIDIDDLAVIDDGEQLVLAPPGGLDRAVDPDREHGRRKQSRRAADEIAHAVALTYYDPARDYQPGLQRAAYGAAAGDAKSEQLGLAAAMSADDARALAERRLDRLWAERESLSLAVSWRDADLRPGMRVTVDQGGRIWRIKRTTLGPMRVTAELTAVARTGAGTPTATTPGRSVQQRDVAHGPTILRLLDLPLGEIVVDGVPALAVAAAGRMDGWRAASLAVSRDGGASWEDIGSTAPAAITGHALTPLPPGDAALFDLGGRVDVELVADSMMLIGRDDDALVAGANLLLVGNELIQFGRADPIGPRRYRLSRLLRGRRGTEWATGGHTSGEAVTLVEPRTLRAVAAPAGNLVKVLASGVGDDIPVATERVAGGEALRPPSPVHLHAAPSSDGAVLLGWTRRSRGGWTWVDGVDAPLVEERELYLVTLRGAGFERSVTVPTTAFTYSAADRAADGPGAVTAEIRQIGTHARSRPAGIIL